MLTIRFIVNMLLMGLMVTCSDGIFSQDYPSKPIRIVTAAAGGGSDYMARQIAQGISGPLGQPVVVENRGGLLTAEIVPGYESIGISGILAPAKTPGAIISRLNQEIVRLLNRVEVKQQFLNAGVEIIASSPEQFAAALHSDIAKWGKVIKDAGIHVE